MKKQIQDYFYYTRRERNGALILATLCLVINFTPRLYPLFHQVKETGFSAFEAAIAEWEQVKTVEQDSLFPFDPNTASERDLIRLGIPAKTVKTLINYRNKGGRFFQKEDLKKVYGLPELIYHQLEPLIKIKEEKAPRLASSPSFKFKSNQTQKKAIKETISIDINQASAEEWKQLHGIGPVLSERIVKFRDKLGGFSSIGQVAQTYGLPDSIFQSIEPSLKVSPVINKIAINQVDAATLQKHPYLNWRQAKAIVNYRELHGDYRDIEDLKKLRVLSEELCDQLRPYLTY